MRGQTATGRLRTVHELLLKSRCVVLLEPGLNRRGQLFHLRTRAADVAARQGDARGGRMWQGRLPCPSLHRVDAGEHEKRRTQRAVRERTSSFACFNPSSGMTLRTSLMILILDGVS